MEPEVMVQGGIAMRPPASPMAGLMVSPSNEAPAVARLIEQLIMLAAFLKELETQAHLIHVGLESPIFLAVHAFLKDQYEGHLDQLDQVLEVVRSMDYFTPMCSEGLRQACCNFRHVSTYDAKDMLSTYYGNLETMGYLAKEIEQLAAKVGAPDVQNLMAELVGSAFKSSWQIKATLRKV